ncbi:MAG: hypothetical protein V4604_12210 [Bacteroidota bacterium]
MKLFLTIVLIVHVVAGFAALGVGLGAILSKKGQRVHKLTGRTFFYLMLAVAVSAAVVSTIKLNEFLLLIAGFAAYQNIGGYRSVKNKQLKPNWIDWLATALGLVTSVFMIASLNIVLLVFGSICLSLVVLDLRTYYAVFSGKAIPKLAWLARHIGFMMGAYIATFTAFVVVNVQNVQPAWIPWLAPTVVGVPLMQYWTWKYTRRKNGKFVAVSDK